MKISFVCIYVCVMVNIGYTPSFGHFLFQMSIYLVIVSLDILRRVALLLLLLLLPLVY